MIRERLIGYIEQSIKQNWDIEALSNYKEKGFSYKEIAGMMLKQQLFFKDIGIKEGDKIALVGRNSANWCTVYLATVTYGAVIVPILPDFKAEDLTNLINHSDAIILYIDEKILEALDTKKLPAIASKSKKQEPVTTAKSKKQVTTTASKTKKPEPKTVSKSQNSQGGYYRGS